MSANQLLKDAPIERVHDPSDDASPSLSKVTPPTLQRVHHNARLFARLDAACARPVVWIHGPPGAGKTTLAASYLAARGLDPLWYRLDSGDADPATLFLYLAAARKPGARPIPRLTPDYRGALPLFARRFFDGLMACPRTATLVFDDYHEIAPEAPVHACFAAGLEEVPSGRRVIVVSRSPPPPQLARLRVNGIIEVVEPEALRVTPEEAEGLARQHTVEMDRAGLDRIVRRAQGWAAGVILMLEAAGETPPAAAADADVPEVMFDYFAGEVLRRFEPRVQHLLYALALMPTTTAAAAVRLTGETDAGAVLEGLRRRNFFTVRDAGTAPSYRFHPLFREFLLTSARKHLNGDWLDELRVRAADVLDEDAQPDAAISLLVEAKASDKIASLVKRRASALLTEGRHDTLTAWIGRLPSDRVQADPWLCRWAGAAVVSFDPIKARPLFSRAFGLFEAADDADGMFVSWAGLAMALHGDLFVDGASYDQLLATMRALTARHPLPENPSLALPLALGMYVALSRRGADRAEITRWRTRVLTALQDVTEPGQSASIHYVVVLFDMLSGEFAAARALHDRLPHPRELADHPIAQHRGYLALTVAQIWRQVPGDCVETVRAALEQSRRFGFQVRDHLFACQAARNELFRGETEAGSEWLKIAVRSGDRRFPGGGAFYHLIDAQRALLLGADNEALSQAEAAVAIGTRHNWRLNEAMARLTLAEVHVERREFCKAVAELDRLDAVLAIAGSRALDISVDLLRSDLLLARGDTAGGLTSLAKALASGRERGDRRATLLPSRVARLCALALSSGIEPDYVRILIRVCEISPPSEADEAWPWPVKIKTFGGLTIELNGELLAFARKTPKRLVMLLKAIAAHGGVAVPETRLVDAVWPDEEGDAGHRALTVALHRLRKLLGEPGILIVKGGRIGLNPARCWLDLWAFQRALARRGPEESDRDQRARIGRGLALYAGDFLAGDNDLWWAMETRERTRDACLRGRRLLVDATDRSVCDQ